MKLILRILSLLSLAVRRLIHQRALTLCMLLGMTLAVALATAIPAYVNVAQANVLRQKLFQAGIGASASEGAREPFGMLFTFISLDGVPIDRAGYDKLDAFVAGRPTKDLVLPLRAVRRTLSTDRYRVYGSGATELRYKRTVTETALFGANAAIETPYLFFGSFDAIPGINEHISFDDGQAPKETPEGQPIEMMVERGFANKHGLQAGDTFTVAISYRTKNDNGEVAERLAPIQARISGIWRANDQYEDFWTLAPVSMRESFVISEETLTKRVMAVYPYVITLAIWNMQLDADSLTIDAVDPLVARFSLYKKEVFQITPSFRVTSRAMDSLNEYRKSASELNLVLTVFSLPTFAMVVYFLALISGMVTRQQESELAILQSRGASAANVFLLYAAQSIVLGLLAFALGLPAGMAVAGLIANTHSFLDFGFDPKLFLIVFRLTAPVVRAAALACFATVVVTMLPVFGAVGKNIIGHGASRARSLRKPFWQRAWLDVLLLIPCVYTYLQLRNRGSLSALTASLKNVGELGSTVAALTASDDPFRDPVRFLIPVLTVTALGLFAARLLPYVIGALARVVGLSRSRTVLPVFLALRELARSPGDYVAPLVLLIFTLGAAIFGASAARTLDRHLIESTLLTVGGEARLVEDGISNKPASAGAFGIPTTPASNKPELFEFAPVEDHLKIPNVRNYARIARIKVAPQAEVVDQETTYTNFALDRRAFQQIAAPAFRRDYASRDFNDLMNALGRKADGVLLNRRFKTQNGLQDGDKLVLQYAVDAGTRNVTYTIAGDFVYFPVASVDEKNIGFVTNIGFTFDGISKDVPYEVLLDLAPGASGNQAAVDAIEKQDFLVNSVEDSAEIINTEQSRPERQGMFGVLSASFVFVTTLTLTGFAVYALLSFKRRSIEIGVMRAMGLSAGQMGLYVVFLQTFVVVLGAGIGGALGMLVSYLFVPFLQVGGKLIKTVPAFFVRLAWQDAAWFYVALGVALILVLAGSLLFLRRLRVFEVVKMGAQ